MNMAYLTLFSTFHYESATPPVLIQTWLLEALGIYSNLLMIQEDVIHMSLIIYFPFSFHSAHDIGSITQERG